MLNMNAVSKFTKKNPPPNFYSYTKKKKTFFHCSNSKIVGTKKVYCAHEVRSDKANNNHDLLKHRCFSDIKQYCTPVKASKPVGRIKEKIVTTVIKANISIRTACSPQFRDLLQTVYEDGQNNPLMKFNDYLPKYSRKTFTQGLVQIAKSIKDEKLDVFENYPFSSLAVDAGKINCINYYAIVLVNVKLEPFVIANIHDFGGTTEDYKNSITEILTMLNGRNIHISSIIGDNLKAQKIAIDDRNKKSFQKNNENQYMRSIIYCPCQCHCLALAIKDLIKTNEDFSYMIDCLKGCSKLFRSKLFRQALNKKCPSFGKTRWTILYDISCWFLKNYDFIVSFLKKSHNKTVKKVIQENAHTILECVTHIAPRFVLLLFCFAKLIHILESDKTPFSMSYHLSEQANQCTKKIIEEYCPDLKKLADELFNLIKSRLEFGRAAISRAAYLFTRQGRNEYRKKNVLRNDNVEIHLLQDGLPNHNGMLNNDSKGLEMNFTIDDIENQFFKNILIKLNQEDDIYTSVLSSINSTDGSLNERRSNTDFNENSDLYQSNASDEDSVDTRNRKSRKKASNSEETSSEDFNFKENDDSDDYSIATDVESDNVFPIEFEKYCHVDISDNKKDEIIDEEEEKEEEDKEEEEEDIDENSEEEEEEEEEKIEDKTTNSDLEENHQEREKGSKIKDKSILELFKSVRTKKFTFSESDEIWRTLSKIIDKLNWDKEKKDQTFCSYILWLFLTDQELNIPSSNDCSDDVIWNILRQRKEFIGLAELRDRLSYIVASEAVCERLFSLLKSINKPYSTRISEEVEMAKIIVKKS